MSTDASASTTEPLTDQIYEEIRERTSPEEAITSAELSERLRVRDAEGNPKTRELIREVMKTRNFPIAACNDGYYVASRGHIGRARLTDASSESRTLILADGISIEPTTNAVGGRGTGWM